MGKETANSKSEQVSASMLGFCFNYIYIEISPRQHLANKYLELPSMIDNDKTIKLFDQVIKKSQVTKHQVGEQTIQDTKHSYN